jgi:Tol biopolymer transport system component
LRAALLLLIGLTVLAGCGQPLPLPDGATAVPNVVAAAPGRPEGRLLYIRGGNVWAWSNGQEFQLTKEGNYSQPRWSPSGNNMVYVRRGDSYADLYVADSAGLSPRALTANQAKGFQVGSKEYVDNSYFLTGPTWGRSPEGGDRIVFSTDRENSVMALWVINGLNGRPQPVFGTSQLGTHVEGSAISPDSNFVVFARDMVDDENVRSTWLYIVDLNTGLFSAIGEDLTNVYDPAWSPDGQWIAYSAREGNQTHLWIIHPDGTGRQRLVGDGRNRGAVWSPDGTQIAFARQQDAGFGLFFIDLEANEAGFNASKPQRIGEFADIDPASGVSWVR